jgi:hypothetical protein
MYTLMRFSRAGRELPPSSSRGSVTVEQHIQCTHCSHPSQLHISFAPLDRHSSKQAMHRHHFRGDVSPPWACPEGSARGHADGARVLRLRADRALAFSNWVATRQVRTLYLGFALQHHQCDQAVPDGKRLRHAQDDCCTSCHPLAAGFPERLTVGGGGGQSCAGQSCYMDVGSLAVPA